MIYDQSIIDELLAAEAALNPDNRKYNPTADAYITAYATIRAAKIAAETPSVVSHTHQWNYGAGGAGPYYGTWDARCGGPARQTVGGAG